jgi:hypothetical protein
MFGNLENHEKIQIMELAIKVPGEFNEIYKKMVDLIVNYNYGHFTLDGRG